MRLAALGALVLAAGCGSAAADHERLGDRAYDAQQYEVALAEYRAGARTDPSARLWAKLGAAAAHAHDFQTAADAYRRLAAADPTRAGEAAEGLLRAAVAAERADDVPGGHALLLALRTVAPTRGVGRLAVSLTRGADLQPGEAVGLLPYVLAGSPDAGATDSLLAGWGDALRATTACDEAAAAYAAVLRRSQAVALRRRATVGLGTCAAVLGADAQAAGDAPAAERWFLAAVRLDSTSAAARRAMVGLGDLRAAAGDPIAAALMYERARAQRDDSIAAVAAERLGALGTAGLPDTSPRP